MTTTSGNQIPDVTSGDSFPVNIGREYYSVVTSVGVFGEGDESDEVSATAWGFNLAAPMPNARYGHVTLPHPGASLAAFGGHNDSGQSDKIDVYDMDDTIRGSDKSSFKLSIDSLDMYDSTLDTTGSWDTTDSMTDARYNHTATRLPDDSILIAGGGDGWYGIVNSSEIFYPFDTTNDPNGSWITADSMNDSRLQHTATRLLDGRVLVAGGDCDSFPYFHTSCEIFDPTDTTNDPNGSWSVAETLTTGRQQHAATLLVNGQVMVTGGKYISTYLSSSETFDPFDTTNDPNGSWSVAETLNTGRFLHTANRLKDGRVLIAGGSFYVSGWNYLSSCELYTYYMPPDASAPEVSGQSPDDNDTGIPTDTSIELTIGDPLIEGSSFFGVDRDTITVTVEGVDAILNGVFQSGFSGVIVADKIGGFFIRIIPDTAFSSAQVVDITVDADDLAPTPNSMTTESSSFTCN